MTRPAVRTFCLAAALLAANGVPAQAAVMFDYVDFSGVSGFSGAATHTALGTVTISGGINSGSVFAGTPEPGLPIAANPTLLAEFSNTFIPTYTIAENEPGSLDAILTFDFANPLPSNGVIVIGSIRGFGVFGAQLHVSFVDLGGNVQTDLSSWTAYGDSPSIWFDRFSDPTTPPTDVDLSTGFFASTVFDSNQEFGFFQPNEPIRSVTVRYVNSETASGVDRVFLGFGTPAVPEPSTLVLWSLGAVGLGGLGWRRRKRGT